MKIRLLILLTLFSFNSYAGGFVEPFLGYMVSGKTKPTLDNVTHEYSYSGLGYGFRAGYQLSMVMAGIEYSTFSLGADDTASTGTESIDASRKSYSLFFGGSLPMALSAWGKYYFKNDFEYKTSDRVADKLKGGGFGLGVGYSGLPFVKVNLEYNFLKMDTYLDASVDEESSLNEFDAFEVILSVSYQFNLF